MKRTLIVENGSMVYIENENGDSKSFSSFSEFFAYSGIDLTGKNYIDYEPDDNLFIDDTDDAVEIPHAAYDEVIEGISDPYYRLSVNDSRNLAYATQVEAIEIRKQAENEKPFPYGDYTYKSDPSAENDVGRVLGQCALYPDTDLIPTFPRTPSLTGKWITIEDVPVLFTCGEFKVFAIEYFNRFSWNFDNRVEHQLMLLATYNNPAKTAQDILNYDFSGGWK